MHSRDKGKSGSGTPTDKTVTSATLKPKEIEKIIVKLTKAGNSQSKIGLILRDSYGIPSTKKVMQKTIAKIQQEQKVLPELPENLTALIKKEIMIIKHLEENHKDKPARRGLQLTESKIRRLVKYYKKSGVLPQDWKYSKEQAKLLVG